MSDNIQDQLPQNYNPKESEKKWQDYWEANKIYEFDKESKKPIFSIDTPPPTVSGKMHLGHSFSYAHQDIIARYQRMRGKNVFYPFGTDDNGLPTERLIEKVKGVKLRKMPRDEFIKLCISTLDNELRPQYIADWKRIGMSCDWNIRYSTIDPHCQKISQRELIHLNNKGRLYRKDAPSMWCPECNTGISQVECVDQEISSFFNDIVFKVNGENLIIATTRPELLPACVAVFYHPVDTRYHHLKGKMAKVPVFNFEVPILEDERADPTKGTGIVMCCTFGDQTDMEWQRAHNLEIKQAITSNGKMTELAGKYAGLSIKEARKAISIDMKEQGLLLSQKPIKHPVNTHERCGTEIEYIKSKQWFIRYLDLKEDMLAWGNQLNWHPKHMKNRYDNWVKGLAWDWLISRQRYFGVPFPIWYCARCDEPIFAEEKHLPVDPLKDKPEIKKCPKCGHNEFTPEKDVLDTWVTSSLTPRLAIELMPKHLWEKLYPMSLRPQAHDIITFWLFNTTFRSNVHFECNPWNDCMISGWALDPKGKKMSKSVGNVIEPQPMIEKYSADSLRFWAAGSKLGEDIPFQEKDFVTGQKFITKFWNASKFGFMNIENYNKEEPETFEAFDLWLLSKLNNLVRSSTESMERYEYSRTKADTERFFWQTLCDNYFEISKDRIYNPDRRGEDAQLSAKYTLYHSLLTCLKLIAPIMPYFTEEIYQFRFAKDEKKKSIHISHWPEYNETFINPEIEETGDIAVLIIAAARKFKSEKALSQKAEISRITIECSTDFKEKLTDFLEDIKETIHAKEIEFGQGTTDIAKDIKITITA